MQQKIEWYKEVLELEPNSKVFFSLARVLVSAKQVDEAIVVLTTGLSKHPYFIEARLLLVELLSAGGKHERLWHEVDKVSEMLGGYPSFWNAWAARLALEDSSRDTALAVSFVAASLQKVSVSWSEVIESGLRACLSKNGLTAPLTLAPGATTGATTTGTTAGASQTTAPIPASLNLAEAQKASPVENASDGDSLVSPATLLAPLENSQPTAQTAQTGQTGPLLSTTAPSKPSLEFEVDSLEELQDELECEAPDEDFAESAILPDFAPAAVFDSAAVPPEIVFEERPFFNLSEDLSETEAVNPPLASKLGDSADSAELVTEPSETLVSAENCFDEDEDVESEELYSLRTRSMAAILAEQGDYAGAKEIYIELLGAANTQAELVELKDCVEDMQKRHSSQGQDAASKVSNVASASQGVRMNDQVFSKLKRLVGRLETRSQL